MSSGVVNPLATETSSTWTAGGGGGVIRLDIPPLQPAEKPAPTMHTIGMQIDVENRTNITFPGWHSILPFRIDAVEPFTAALCRCFAKSDATQPKAPFAVLWQNRDLQGRNYGSQNHTR